MCLLAGLGVLYAERLRKRVLHDWRLLVRVFMSQTRAERCSLSFGSVPAKVRAHPPRKALTTSCALWATLPDGNRLVDMNDGAALGVFFMDTHRVGNVWGVQIRACTTGVPITRVVPKVAVESVTNVVEDLAVAARVTAPGAAPVVAPGAAPVAGSNTMKPRPSVG